MSDTLNEMLLAAFLVFCRIGSCMMLAPGTSSARIPMQVRLMLAVTISIALTPVIWPDIDPIAAKLAAAPNLVLLLSEIAIGIMIGLMARCFLLAAQFAATFAATAIGLAGMPGVPVEETEALVPLASFISLAAAMMLLAAGLHLEILEALIRSYDAWPAGQSLQQQWMLSSLVDAIADTSVLGLRLAAPFAVYAVIVNIAIGFAGKFTPQMQIYFVSTGAIMLGGFVVLWLVTPDWLLLFVSHYETWLRDGVL